MKFIISDVLKQATLEVLNEIPSKHSRFLLNAWDNLEHCSCCQDEKCENPNIKSTGEEILGEQ